MNLPDLASRVSDLFEEEGLARFLWKNAEDLAINVTQALDEQGADDYDDEPMDRHSLLQAMVGRSVQKKTEAVMGDEEYRSIHQGLQKAAMEALDPNGAAAIKRNLEGSEGWQAFESFNIRQFSGLEEAKKMLANQLESLSERLDLEYRQAFASPGQRRMLARDPSMLMGLMKNPFEGLAKMQAQFVKRESDYLVTEIEKILDAGTVPVS